MDNEKLIDKIANHLKEDCQGSTDYLSGINDGVYKTLHYCLDRNMIPVQDVREKAKEFLLKMSKEPSMMSTESMLVKFYCDLNGTAKRLTLNEVKPLVIEKFADNGEFSHYELINPKTNEVLWTEEKTDDETLNENIESLKDYLNTFKYNDDATEHNTLIKQSEIYGAYKALQWLKNEFRLDIGNAKYNEWRKNNQ